MTDDFIKNPIKRLRVVPEQPIRRQRRGRRSSSGDEISRDYLMCVTICMEKSMVNDIRGWIRVRKQKYQQPESRSAFVRECITEHMKTLQAGVKSNESKGREVLPQSGSEGAAGEREGPDTVS